MTWGRWGPGASTARYAAWERLLERADAALAARGFGPAQDAYWAGGGWRVSDRLNMWRPVVVSDPIDRRSAFVPVENSGYVYPDDLPDAVAWRQRGFPRTES